MAGLVVLESHLWLTLMDIKDADKVSFLDAPIFPRGLFGPAVNGFAERFTEAQKASQVMRHFLPSAPAQQLLRVAPRLRRLSSPRSLHLPFPPLSLPRLTPFSSGCRGNCVCCYRARTSAHATVRCDSGKNKTQTFSKREQFSSSVPHECLLCAAGHSSLSNPLPRGPRPGRPSPECQIGLWG